MREAQVRILLEPGRGGSRGQPTYAEAADRTEPTRRRSHDDPPLQGLVQFLGITHVGRLLRTLHGLHGDRAERSKVSIIYFSFSWILNLFICLFTFLPII